MVRFRLALFAAVLGFASLGLSSTARAHPVLSFPVGGEQFLPATQITVVWWYLINHGPGIVNILISSDGGVSFGQPVATVNWPAAQATVTLPTAEGCQYLLKVEYLPQSGDQYPYVSGPFCITDPAVLTSGFAVGNTFDFHVDAPNAPNGTAVVFANATGLTGVLLPLPGGVTVDLLPDVWMFILLSIPAVTVIPLDAGGSGNSVPVLIPNNPNLLGWTWATAIAVLPQGNPIGWPFQEASLTSTPSVQ